jgi:hypothetical protein
MPEVIICPSCGARLTVKNFLRGMRVKCPKCQAAFSAQAAGAAAQASPPPAPTRPPVARPASRPPPPPAPPPPEDDEYDVSDEPLVTPAPLSPAPKRSTTSPLSYRSAPPTEKSPPFEMTPARRGYLRLGITFFAFGLASLILPLFGLQFRKLQGLGENAWIASVALMGLGVLVALLSVVRLRARSVLMLGGGIVAGVVLLFLALGALGMILRASRRPPTFPSAAPPPPPGPPVISGAPRPRVSPPPPLLVNPGVPRPPVSAPPVTDDAIVARYGAEKVVRVTVSGPDMFTVRDAVVFRRLRDAVRSAGAQTQTTRPQDNTITCVAAPVEDLDAVANALDLGVTPTIDRATRTITVQLTGPPKGSQRRPPSRPLPSTAR